MSTWEQSIGWDEAVRRLPEVVNEVGMAAGAINEASVVAGTVHLAQRRARANKRDPIAEDIAYAASLFCWWPFKPKGDKRLARELARIRRQAFGRGLPQNPRTRFASLDSMVPDRALQMDLNDLYEVQLRGDLKLIGLRARARPQRPRPKKKERE